MKKNSFFLIVCLVGGLAIGQPGWAVNKYVNLYPNSQCQTPKYTEFGSEWSVWCAGYGSWSNGSQVSGIGICIDGSGGTDYGYSTSYLVPSSGNGTDCWCKMLTPAVSQWVYAWSTRNESPGANCYRDCSRKCAEKLVSRELQSGMFSGLSD